MLGPSGGSWEARPGGFLQEEAGDQRAQAEETLGSSRSGEAWGEVFRLKPFPGPAAPAELQRGRAHGYPGARLPGLGPPALSPQPFREREPHGHRSTRGDALLEFALDLGEFYSGKPPVQVSREVARSFLSCIFFCRGHTEPQTADQANFGISPLGASRLGRTGRPFRPGTGSAQGRGGRNSLGARSRVREGEARPTARNRAKLTEASRCAASNKAPPAPVSGEAARD